MALAVVAAGATTIGGPTGAQVPPLDGPPLCGSEAGPGAEAADDGTLRVATYNILHTVDDYADETQGRCIELVADELAAAAVDIVGMQEVVRSARHGVVAQRVAQELAARTGDTWAWCFFQSNPHLPGEPDTGPGGVGGPISQQIAELARAGDAPWSEGVAILARFPIVDQAAHRLVPRGIETPACVVANPTDPLAAPTCAFDTRQVLFARVATSCGEVDMFSSHLANDASPVTEEVRVLQALDALAQIDAWATEDEAPDVYTGDFNTEEGSPVWQAVVDGGFVDGFRAAEPSAAGFTGGQAIDDPSPTVDQRIDYVFVRPGSELLTPTEAEILGDAPVPFEGSGGEAVVWPSDHYGVAVSLPFAEPCGQAQLPAPMTSSPEPTTGAAETEGALPATGGVPGGWLVTAMVAMAAAVGMRGVRDRSSH